MARTLIGIADGLLPVEAVGEVVTLQIVATGEAQELWLHFGHHFHEVDT